jgi:inosine/xanthosine triphosphate pyrophosphatase family protein
MRINTSNSQKLAELRKFIGPLDATQIDLREPDADALTVAAVKALQAGPEVLIDDASLDVEGADIGVHVKWRMGALVDLVGKPAVFRVTLAYQTPQGEVRVYQGAVRGQVCQPVVEGFGFDAFFQPEGSPAALSVHKPDNLNPRSLACQALLADRPIKTFRPFVWEGPWQEI